MNGAAGKVRAVLDRGQTSRSIVEGPIYKAVLRLAIPTWASFVTHDLMGIVDMFFVGKLGPEAVAAVGLSGAMIGIVIMLAQSVTVGTTTLVANACGRNDPERAAVVAGQGVAMALGLSILLAAVGIPFAPAVVRLMGAEGEVIDGGAAYLRIISGGGFAMLLAISLASALRGAGDAVTPFWAMMTANLVNIVLDPILIFGWLGAPALGVAGSAWATMIGRCVGAVMMAHVFFRSDRGLIRLKWRHLAPSWETMRRIAGIGIFSSGRVLVRNIAMLVLMRLAASFGTTVLAAFGLCFRLQMALFGPTMGFSMAAATVAGQNLGARDPDRARRGGWTAAAMACTIAVGISLIYWFGAPVIIPVFNDAPEVVRHGTMLLRWVSPSFAFLALTMVLSFAMNGAGDTLRPMLLMAVALLLFGLPLAFLLVHLWQRPEGVWVGMAASNVMAGCLAVLAFHAGPWVRIGLAHADREEDGGSGGEVDEAS